MSSKDFSRTISPARMRGCAGLATVISLVGASLLGPTLATAATPTVTEFSSGFSPGGNPEAITAGPDGNLWFSENDGNKIGRITPSGTVTEFSAGISSGAGPRSITTGADGNLWFCESNGNSIGRITPSGTITEFSVGISPGASLFDITAGPDGNLWFTEYGTDKIGQITTSGTVAEFSAGISPGARPDRITASPDGTLWFTEGGTDKIGRITTGGAITEFSAGISPGASPDDITAGPDGNIWFTELGGNKIGRITTGGTVTEFSAGISPGAGLGGITPGPDGNIWFTEFSGPKIGRITPNGAVTEFSAGISPGAHPYSMTAGPDANLWFTEFHANQIARINTALNQPTYTNAARIVVPASGTIGEANPYPATINVSGLGDRQITGVSVQLRGISHSFPDDIDALLVGPQGQNVLLVSDIGGANAAHGVTLSIADAAPYSLLDVGPTVSGIFKPTNSDTSTDAFPSPAPAGSYGTALSAFNATNPNGAWRLYVRDDTNGDVGAIHGGWGLNLALTPQTTIISHPKRTIKTKKRKAKVAFSFTATPAPGASFECKLDATAFAPCSSPKIYKARRGKHSFAVQATVKSVADPAPATFAFKVKRKRR